VDSLIGLIEILTKNWLGTRFGSLAGAFPANTAVIDREMRKGVWGFGVGRRRPVNETRGASGRVFFWRELPACCLKLGAAEWNEGPPTRGSKATQQESV